MLWVQILLHIRRCRLAAIRPCNLSVYIAECSRLNLKLEEAFRPPLHLQSYLSDLRRRHPLLSPINSAYIWRSLDEVHTQFRVFQVLLVNPAVSQTLQKPTQTRSHSDKYTSSKYIWATRAYGKSTITRFVFLASLFF